MDTEKDACDCCGLKIFTVALANKAYFNCPVETIFVK